MTKKIFAFSIFALVLAFYMLAASSCAHYPLGDEEATDTDAGPQDGGHGHHDGGSDRPDGGSGGGSGSGSDGGTCCGGCPAGQHCHHGMCVPDDPPPPACCSNEDCGSGTVCKDGTCVCDGEPDDGDHACRPGKTLLCHYPGRYRPSPHEICVADAAVMAHQNHGDTVGRCPR